MTNKTCNGGCAMLKWLDNFWYHHKWVLIIAIFFVVFIVIGIFQMATRTEYDLKVLYAGPTVLLSDERAEGIKSVLSDFTAEDIDGDGKKTVLLNSYSILSDEQLNKLRDEAKAEDDQIFYDPTLRTSTINEISTLLATGEVSICFMDEYVYTMFCDKDGMFVPLSEIIGNTPDTAYDDYSIRLRDTDFASYFGAMSALPDDTLVCIRQLSYMTGAGKSKTAVKEHECALETFKKMLTFESPIS